MALSLFWCLIFIYLMSEFAEPLSWFLVYVAQLGLFIASGGGIYFCVDAIQDRQAAATEADIPDGNGLKIAFFGGVGISALIFLICTCCR